MKLRVVTDGDTVNVTAGGEPVEGVRTVVFQWERGQPPLLQVTVVGEADIVGFDD